MAKALTTNKEKVRKTARFPFIAPTFHRPGQLSGLAQTMDQHFINCCFSSVKNEHTETIHYTVYKRPGISNPTPITAGKFFTAVKIQTGSSNYALYEHESNGDLLIVDVTSVGSTLDTIAAGGVGSTSRITPITINATEKCILFWFADNGSGNRAFLYNITTDTTTEITDAAYLEASYAVGSPISLL